MDAQQLAMGMMYMDNLRFQHWNHLRCYENSYQKQRNQRITSINSHTNPINIRIQNPTTPQNIPQEKETVEFPIESYNVLTGRNDGVISIIGEFLICLEVEGFDWNYYSERILKGLNFIEQPLKTYLKTESSLIDILEYAGFSKRLVEINGVRWVRLEKSGGKVKKI